MAIRTAGECEGRQFGFFGQCTHAWSNLIPKKTKKNTLFWRMELKLVCSGQGAIRLEMKASKENAYPGDSFTITCTTTGLSSPTYISLVKVLPDDTTITIASNGHKEPSFDSLTRYVTHLETPDRNNPTIIAFPFTVTDAKLEDAGVYKCEIFGNDGVMEELTESVTISIVKDPESIQLFMTSPSGEIEVMDGTTFELDSEVRRSIRCMVTGSSPEPVVTLTLNGVDVTDEFTSQVDPTMTPSEDHPELQQVLYSKTMVAEGFKIDARFYRGFFRCTAYAPHSQGGEQLIRSFSVNFAGEAPFYTNCTESYLSYIGESNVEVSCQVSGEPVPMVTVKFHREAKTSNETIVLNPGDEFVGTRFEMYEENAAEGETSGHVNINLKFDRMFAQMFREYTFIAENDVGTRMHVLTMERDYSREDTAGASRAASSALAVALFTVVLGFCRL